MTDPFTEYHALVDAYPERFCDEIKKTVGIQRAMLKLYDFLPDKGRAVVDWIERFCILPGGERAGEPVRLMLWQRWFIYSIFCFWGHFEEDVLDDAGRVVGRRRKYLRVVNDILMVIAAGNAKTTLLGFLNTYLLFSRDYPAANIYIGSNAQKQSRLCFDTTMRIIGRNRSLKRYLHAVPSLNFLEVRKKDGLDSMLTAMSSDGRNFEGIIPTNVMIDEIHAMTTSAYADNLRKSVKRDDGFVFETTTMGTERGGYLDERLEYAKKILDGDAVNHRFFCCIFKQDSEDEIFAALESGDTSVYLKSNPGFGHVVSATLLTQKARDMADKPRERAITMTKNFNIPQNPVTCYFSEAECRALPFDEAIFNGAPVFLGLDMAYTRSPESDLACLTMMTADPATEREYYKDFYFLPRWLDRQVKNDGGLTVERLDMITEKSRYDTNILYDEGAGRYGYAMYAARGDIVVIDDALVGSIRARYGDDAAMACDVTGVTQKFIMYFIALIEARYGFTLCKMGIDPNKAGEIESFVNAHIASQDGLPPAIKFQMEKSLYSYPLMEATKDIRARGLAHCNNKLTELHFASALTKERGDGTAYFVHSQRSHIDGVSAHLAARSAYTVFITNGKTGAVNKARLGNWWSRNRLPPVAV